MNDTIGSIYDHDTFIAFAVHETKLDAEIVERAARLRDILEAVIGVCPMEGSEFDPPVDLAALRLKYGVTAKQISERFLSYDREAMFISIESGVSLADVCAIMAVDSEYKARLGIIDRSGVDDYRDWVPGFLAAQQPNRGD